MKISRREFLKYAATGAAMVGFGGMFAGCVQRVPEKVTPTKTPSIEKRTFRIGTAQQGTFGYTAGVAFASMARKYGGLDVQTIPTPGSLASWRYYENGEVDTVNDSGRSLYLGWHNEGPFKEKPIKKRAKPHQTLYFYTVDYYIMVREDSDIENWEDLEGKKFVPGVIGSSLYDLSETIFKSLGIWDNIEKKQIDYKDIPDAMKLGTIDASLGYTVSYTTLPSWGKEVDARADVRIIRPTSKQLKIVKEKVKGVIIAEVPVGEIWSQDVGVEKLPCVILPYGFHAGPDVPENTIYSFVKVIFEHSEELLDVSAGFKLFHERGLELNKDAINSVPDVPVHPGMQKYLEEGA